MLFVKLAQSLPIRRNHNVNQSTALIHNVSMQLIYLDYKPKVGIFIFVYHNNVIREILLLNKLHHDVARVI